MLYFIISLNALKIIIAITLNTSTIPYTEHIYSLMAYFLTTYFSTTHLNEMIEEHRSDSGECKPNEYRKRGDM